MAFDLLGAPASSSAEERTFSKAGHSLNDERKMERCPTEQMEGSQEPYDVRRISSNLNAWASKSLLVPLALRQTIDSRCLQCWPMSDLAPESCS